LQASAALLCLGFHKEQQQLVLQVLKGQQVLKAILVLQALKVSKVRKVSRASKALKGPPAQLV